MPYDDIFRSVINVFEQIKEENEQTYRNKENLLLDLIRSLKRTEYSNTDLEYIYRNIVMVASEGQPVPAVTMEEIMGYICSDLNYVDAPFEKAGDAQLEKSKKVRDKRTSDWYKRNAERLYNCALSIYERISNIDNIIRSARIRTKMNEGYEIYTGAFKEILNLLERQGFEAYRSDNDFEDVEDTIKEIIEIAKTTGNEKILDKIKRITIQKYNEWVNNTPAGEVKKLVFGFNIEQVFDYLQNDEMG